MRAFHGKNTPGKSYPGETRLPGSGPCGTMVIQAVCQTERKWFHEAERAAGPPSERGAPAGPRAAPIDHPALHPGHPGPDHRGRDGVHRLLDGGEPGGVRLRLDRPGRLELLALRGAFARPLHRLYRADRPVHRGRAGGAGKVHPPSGLCGLPLVFAGACPCGGCPLWAAPGASRRRRGHTGGCRRVLSDLCPLGAGH